MIEGYNFRSFEQSLYEKCHPTREGSIYFSYGTVKGEYSIKRADFDYREEVGSHAYYTDQTMDTSLPYQVLNVGVGAGLEVKKPLTYLRSIAERRQVNYTATNLNTPTERRSDGMVRVLYEPPPDEFLSGENWHIDYAYRDRFRLEEMDNTLHEGVNLFLSSRVVEWSEEPDRWFKNAHDVLAPGGIAVVHTLPWVGTRPNYLDPVALAKEAGFNRGYVFDSRKYEPGKKPILKMFLYKPHDVGLEYDDWVRRNRKVNHFMRVTGDLESKDFTNPVFHLAGQWH